VDGKVFHVRFRSNPKRDGVTYAFNINPNTLRADYEVWICGAANNYYLIPISTIRSLYDDPDTYVDNRHPEIRVADIRCSDHRCLYGKGGKSEDFALYYLATF
jgi:hypothetical protein